MAVWIKLCCYISRNTCVGVFGLLSAVPGICLIISVDDFPPPTPTIESISVIQLWPCLHATATLELNDLSASSLLKHNLQYTYSCSVGGDRSQFPHWSLDFKLKGDKKEISKFTAGPHLVFSHENVNIREEKVCECVCGGRGGGEGI